MKYYHGTSQNNSYFEGWYLKYQTKDGKALALIPALHIDATGRRSISLQILTDSASWWLEYPETEFQASQKRFHVRVGQNTFCDEETQLHVERDGLSLHGTLYHGLFVPLTSDIMGPFRFFAGMECSHGVISMGHLLNGTLTINGEVMDFSGGIGYVETDRGRSFPSAYLWTQCAWHEPQRSSLMLSIATIPLPIGHFTGCICAVIHNGREYRLATYRGVRIEQWSNTGAVIRQGKYRLSAEMLEERGHPLRAPVEGTMGRTVHESLRARLRYRFWKGKELLFEHTDNCASFEYANQQPPVNHSPETI